MAWSARAFGIQEGTIGAGVFGGGFTPERVHGTGDQWTDDDDSTYAQLFSRFGVSLDSHGWTGAGFSPPEELTLQIIENPHTRLAAWVKAVNVSDDRPPTIRISNSGAGTNYAGEAVWGSDPTLGGPGDGWVVSEIIPYPGSTVPTILALWRDGSPGSLFLEVASTFREVEVGDVEVEWHILEAFPVVYVPLGAGPPCRLYPGGIQGTVGGAVRQFPPQKYRQASSRGVGCY